MANVVVNDLKRLGFVFQPQIKKYRNFSECFAFVAVLRFANLKTVLFSNRNGVKSCGKRNGVKACGTKPTAQHVQSFLHSNM